MLPKGAINFATGQEPNRSLGALYFFPPESGGFECFSEFRSKLANVHRSRLKHVPNDFQRAP